MLPRVRLYWWREWLRQWWWLHPYQQCESEFSGILDWPHQQHAQAFSISLFMIAGGEGTCSVCVCAENMFIVCRDHRLIRLHSFDMHGKEGKKVGFISVLPKKFLPVVWNTNIPCNHSPDALASLGPSVCFQAVVLVCININIYQLYILGRPSSAGIPHMEIFSYGRNHWRFYNLGRIMFTITAPSRITFWNLSLGISFTF